MATNLYRGVAYGLSEPLLNVFPAPIVSTRDPRTSDRAQLGSVWVNKSTNDAFVLTSVVANVATWVGIGGGAGTFTSLTVSPGNVTVTTGDIIATLGDITAGAGDISATTGSVSAGTTVSAGTSISAGTTITAGTGLIATTGGVTATAGNITATAGNISAPLGSISTGGVSSGRMIAATGDSGTGFATITSFTNAVDTTQSTGALTLVSASANPGTNAGFLKIYVGLTPAYIPYFTNIAP